MPSSHFVSHTGSRPSPRASTRKAHQLAYTAIRIEGGLLPADELTRLTTLAAPEQTEQTEAHYQIPRGLKLRDEIARHFKIAQSLWQDFAALRQRTDVPAHHSTVQAFLLPLMRQVLGFAELQAFLASGANSTSDNSYQIPYAAWGGSLPLVLAGHDQPLDQASDRFGHAHPDTGRIRRRSPHMLAQEALNASDHALWAIVSNGLKLRILRDNPSLTRPAYIEVDLEAIFNEDLYADFTAFWLLTHASRFGKAPPSGQATEATTPANPAPNPADCPWERWRNAGQRSGETVRANLRYQVADALRSLGTGFLSHPGNTRLRNQLLNAEQSSATKQAFFEELLSLVYRFIFLATVEDRTDPTTGRSLVFTPDATDEQQQRYWQGYSLTWLRERAVRRSAHDTHGDLWQALSITFNGLAIGQPALGLPALGGLFAPEQCPLLTSAHIDNRHLLAAVFQLGYFRQATGLTRVNYRDMGAEELGSVYESLLELVPDIQHLAQPHAARLGFVGDDDQVTGADASTRGNARKLTGSYYTPDSLVQQLITSALEPVIAQTVQAHPANPVQALLQLTVCDPACGSGHFLLAAARRLADEVAHHRAAAQGGAPTPADYRHALRDVVGHCIYGVDKNPMAIALAKTALWLEAYTPDRPLTFIDHHLQVGDALLGVLHPQILENGIPDAAYTPLSGDDKATASALKKQNKAELKSWKQVVANDLFAAANLGADATAVEHLADDTLAGVAAKRTAWAQVHHLAGQSTLAKLADTYVAAFLAPKLQHFQERVPLSGYLWGLLYPNQNQAPDTNKAEAAHSLCRAHSVFHWWLAFPQVAAKGGFDVMLGNPPWERIKLQEEEFFATRSPLVATANNKAERGKRIELLRQGLLLHTLYPDVEAAEGLSPPNRAEMALHQEFIAARRGAEAASLYAHDSGRYPLTGVGDVNTYALFAESLFQLTASRGRAGFIVPTGIATDDSTKHFFGKLVRTSRLVSLVSLNEIRKWFPDTDDRKPFCLFTIGEAEQAKFIFDVTTTGELSIQSKWYSLTTSEFKLLNPNTLTLPIFRSQRDAELTKKLYRAAPVLIREAEWEGEGKESRLITPEVNPWGISFQRMLDMSNDSHLFQDRPVSVEADSPGTQPHRLPLYEAKMIHQFDHRWATYVDSADKANGLDTADTTPAQKANPHFTVRPRYWVDEREVLARIARVPSRVANAWLAFKAATDAALSDDGGPDELATLANCRASLTQALAGWVTGALWQQAAQAHIPTQHGYGDTGSLFEPEYSEQKVPLALDSKAQAAIQNTVIKRLASQYPALSESLQALNLTASKLLAQMQKWAEQDDPTQGLGLSADELAELAKLCAPATSGTATTPARSLELAFMDCWMDRRAPRWLMGWRDICRSTDERTVIASVVPRVGVGHKMPVIRWPVAMTAGFAAALYGNLCSLTLDFAARQKVGGTSLTYHYLKQFPVLPPSRYTPADLANIIPRVLELTHTAHDMQAWANDLLAAFPQADPRPPELRHTPLPPFPWHPERRAQLRAELDAHYARLYGLTCDELRYILDPADVLGPDYPSETFRVLKNNEMREFGEYRTQQLVLAAWDKLSVSDDRTLTDVDVLPPIYSEQGVIKTEEEASFAGLLLTLVRASVHGLSVDRMQEAVLTIAQAERYLDDAEAQRLRHLSRLMPLLGQTSSLERVHTFVLRLEAAQLLQRKRDGTSVLFVAGPGKMPADVLVPHSHAELANLMLKLEAKRAAIALVKDEGLGNAQVRFAT